MIDVPNIVTPVTLNSKVPVFNHLHRRYDYLKLVDVLKYTLTKSQLKRDCAYANKILEFPEVKLCPAFYAVIHGAFVDYYVTESDADYYLLKRYFPRSKPKPQPDGNHSRLYYVGENRGIAIIKDHHEAHSDVVECAMISGYQELEPNEPSIPTSELTGFMIDPFDGAVFKNENNKFSIEGNLIVEYNSEENKFFISIPDLIKGSTTDSIISSYVTLHWEQFDEEFGFHIQVGTEFSGTDLNEGNDVPEP